MKISKIEVFDYNQFQNFTIDLTYPKGHAKEGLPLDKVCFIGQSGTGKTTLLNIIKELVEQNNFQNNFEKDNKISLSDFEIINNYIDENKVYQLNIII